MASMYPAKKNRWNTALAVLFMGSFIVAIAASWYRYFYTKNYNYLVEGICDPQTETCFYRDCESNPDDCPPNGLSYYKKYTVKGYDFSRCTDNSCLDQCSSGALACVAVECDPDTGDACSSAPVE